jgi:hypothetical protein
MLALAYSNATAVIGVSLIAAIGALMIFYPQKTYELFVFQMGKDNHRRSSPEHGRVYRRLHQVQGAIIFAGAMVLLVLTFGFSK